MIIIAWLIGMFWAGMACVLGASGPVLVAVGAIAAFLASGVLAFVRGASIE